jgi:hypothetical protein
MPLYMRGVPGRSDVHYARDRARRTQIFQNGYAVFRNGYVAWPVPGMTFPGNTAPENVPGCVVKGVAGRENPGTGWPVSRAGRSTRPGPRPPRRRSSPCGQRPPQQVTSLAPARTPAGCPPANNQVTALRSNGPRSSDKSTRLAGHSGRLGACAARCPAGFTVAVRGYALIGPVDFPVSARSAISMALRDYRGS